MSGAPEGRPRGLDWPGLMRAGMLGLGLRPAEFWALTPAELALMLGIEAGAGAMTRDRLAELAARFPD
ncbi:rcc01693 family protein [uncultured Paracoccus sp.]|uniref:rcc01693 family protein n=1 Tax=uncultured Paracoccus sp. TaxID=189685 RepID=UPI002637125B|nr:rcc01693 family protein [uncultured Paracoccus sp.]